MGCFAPVDGKNPQIWGKDLGVKRMSMGVCYTCLRYELNMPFHVSIEYGGRQAHVNSSKPPLPDPLQHDETYLHKWVLIWEGYYQTWKTGKFGWGFSYKRFFALKDTNQVKIFSVYLLHKTNPIWMKSTLITIWINMQKQGIWGVFLLELGFFFFLKIHLKFLRKWVLRTALTPQPTGVYIWVPIFRSFPSYFLYFIF